jgi:ribulose-5-phosphate 4-epimerase/fuculose-1-phosphate aldolase
VRRRKPEKLRADFAEDCFYTGRSMTERYSEQLIAVGKELYARSLVTTRGGNLSVKIGDGFLITRTGKNLGQLSGSDFISVDLDDNTAIPAEASCEAQVHRALYNSTTAQSIVHVHGAHAIAAAISSRTDRIQPVHNEAIIGLHSIPIINTSVPGEESGEDPAAIVEALKRAPALLIRGHGSFATGHSLDQALYRTLLLEDCCRIFLLLRGANSPDAVRERPVESYLQNDA